MNNVNKKTRTKPRKQSWLEGSAVVVLWYSLLAFFSLGIFGLLHVIGGLSTLGYLELLGSAALLGNIVILRIGYAEGAKNLLLMIIFLFLILMLLTGGTNNTGAFWAFVFPVTAFFLGGRRAGTWWMVALLLMIGGVWAASSMQLVHSPYDGVTLRQLIFSVAVVTVGIYVYQVSRERLASQTNESRALLEVEKVRADAIVQNIAEGIVTTDAKGAITYANPAAEKLLGWPPGSLVGKNYTTAIPMLTESGKEVTTENRPVTRWLAHGKATTILATYLRKDRTPVPVSVNGRPLLVGGKMNGVIVTFRDVTEEQNIMRTKSEFVTVASHQLRTPLSAVSWLSEILLSGDAGKLTSEQRDYVVDIHRSSQRMTNLVSEMLIVSGLDMHSLPVMPQKTNLPALISEVVEEQTAMQPAKHAKIHETYDPELKILMCDPDIMKTMLRNLISNALKYTPASGAIIVHATRAPSRKLNPDSKGSIQISVSDTGYGIPKNVTGKVFGKFFRAKNITRRDTDGTGLGLYIVKTLLDYVGGHINFSSEEGKGTTFTVLLPMEGMDRFKPSDDSGKKRGAETNPTVTKRPSMVQ